MTPYQFALLRYRHSATAGERVNVGVVMWLPTEHRLLTLVNERYGRLSRLFQATFDAPSYVQMVRHLIIRFARVSREVGGDVQMSLIDRQPEQLHEIVGVLIPDPESCFEWSLVMAGAAVEPQVRLRQLMHEFVERHEVTGDRSRREDEDVWATIEPRLRSRNLLGDGRVKPGVEVRTPTYSWVFKGGWQNGVQQVMEPISLDYVNSSQVIERATHWSGRLFQLSLGAQFQMTAVVGASQRQKNRAAFERALKILDAAPNVRKIVMEDEVENFFPEIERDLREDQVEE